MGCQETYALYNRNVFLHKDHWGDGLEVGDVVSFLVELNDKGWPQARNIQRQDVMTMQRRMEAQQKQEAVLMQQALVAKAEQDALARIQSTQTQYKFAETHLIPQMTGLVNMSKMF